MQVTEKDQRPTIVRIFVLYASNRRKPSEVGSMLWRGGEICHDDLGNNRAMQRVLVIEKANNCN